MPSLQTLNIPGLLEPVGDSRSPSCIFLWFLLQLKDHLRTKQESYLDVVEELRTEQGLRVGSGPGKKGREENNLAGSLGEESP